MTGRPESKPSQGHYDILLDPNRYDLASRYPTADAYHAKILERKQGIEHLPSEWLQFRESVRNALGIPQNQLADYYGDQVVGAFEPPVFWGKRVLAAAMHARGHYTVDYSTRHDVIGSETEFYTLKLPFPEEPKRRDQPTGTLIKSLVGVNRYNYTPALQTPTSAFDMSGFRQTITQIYGSDKSPRIAAMLKLWEEAMAQSGSYGEALDVIVRNFAKQLGIEPDLYVEDLGIDSLMAQNGGLDLIMDNWDTITRLASNPEYAMEGVRIPTASEAPFYAYIPNQPVNPPVRARIVIQPDGTFQGIHPEKPGILIGDPFTREDIREGRVQIAFRALPKTFLLSTVFDAHITGGGARYNHLVARAYADFFKQTAGVDVEMYPIANMHLFARPDGQLPPQDTQSESYATDAATWLAEAHGLFDYESMARKSEAPEKAEARRLADELVRLNLASSLDLMISLNMEIARQLIAEEVTREDFAMTDRIDLRGAKPQPVRRPTSS